MNVTQRIHALAQKLKDESRGFFEAFYAPVYRQAIAGEASVAMWDMSDPKDYKRVHGLDSVGNYFYIAQLTPVAHAPQQRLGCNGALYRNSMTVGIGLWARNVDAEQLRHISEQWAGAQNELELMASDARIGLAEGMALERELVKASLRVQVKYDHTFKASPKLVSTGDGSIFRDGNSFAYIEAQFSWAADTSPINPFECFPLCNPCNNDSALLQ